MFRLAPLDDPGGRRIARIGLLDLRLAELDMLPHDGVVLAEVELLGLRARVLLRDVEEAGVCAAHELDLDGGRLRHDRDTFELGMKESGRRRRRPRRASAMTAVPPFVKEVGRSP